MPIKSIVKTITTKAPDNTPKFKALHFEITHKCNLRCRHCYNIDYLNLPKPDLATSKVKKIIDIASNLGCQDFGFSGGEPFCRKDILEIIEYAPGPVHILTNGLLIDDFIGKKIKALDKPIEFRVSMDGLESNMRIRNVGYEEVLKKIDFLLKLGFVVTVNTMVTPYNHGELLRMYDTLGSIGVDRWRLDFVFQKGNACLLDLGKEKFNLSLESIRKLIKRYIKEKPKFEFDVNKFFRSFLLKGVKRTTYNLNSIPCSYQGALTVRPDGEVSFCPSLDITFGNILNTPIEKIFRNKEYMKVKNIKVKDIKDCKNCGILNLCGGGCRADAYYSTKSLFSKDKFTCYLMEYFYEKIYKEEFFKPAR